MSETQRLGSEDCDGRGVAGKEKREKGSSESVSVLVTGVKKSRRRKKERRAKIGMREQ
jgi:hypothetical protein